MARFGPAGNSPLFYQQGGKSSVEVPRWLQAMGLNAYEYQAGRGVRIRESLAADLGKQAREHQVALSLHAPYYINLGNPDPAKREKSKDHLFRSLEAARWMEAGRVVFHPGSVGEDGRETAWQTAMEAMEEVIEEARRQDFDPSILSPETMGKGSQLGNIQEVCDMCRTFALIPTVDFAHLHAVSQGGLLDTAGVTEVLQTLQDRLGFAALKGIHVHFSTIEFTRAGERRHHNMDEDYGPDFRLVASVAVKMGLEPTFICESADKQVEDALTMKKLWQEAAGALAPVKH
jgi:deoxyribonuclease-4